ncbi:aspartyl protease family protein [Chloroflexi bacterium TSY]|nr:aspartyl protease family protein [Chloroflexi bacterium TSY]
METARWRNLKAFALIVGVLCMVITTSCQPLNGVTHQDDVKHRGDIEKELGPIEEAYRAAPGDIDNRRDYADILFKLGNVWQANDVIAPLATSLSSNLNDLQLGAKLALLTSDYQRAEMLFNRLSEAADKDSDAYTAAIEGLVMVCYQSNQYAKVKELELPEEGEEIGRGMLLTFMKRFEGEPYQIEWSTPEKVAHLPIINDFAPPGALPLMEFEINGHPVKFILDTGGDRLFVDESVAQTVGIHNIATRQAKYAYTGGEYVEEPLGVAERVTMGNVTLKNVPVIVAKWKAIVGEDHSDGVVTTQILKQFLSTVDYENKRITFRERSERGLGQLLDSFGGEKPHQMPFFMTATHLMYTKGSLNGHQGMNMFMDSGLAASMPLVILDETADLLGLEKNEIEGTQYYWSPIESYGIGPLVRREAQALGNVLVEEDPYWRFGFVFDALVSHQYLQHLGSWTIDFDTMTYYFPAGILQPDVSDAPSSFAATSEKVEIENPDEYVGSYEITPGVALGISTADGILFLEAPGQQAVPLQAEQDGTFSIPMAGAKVVFERNSDGMITGLVLHQDGSKTRATRK